MSKSDRAISFSRSLKGSAIFIDQRSVRNLQQESAVPRSASTLLELKEPKELQISISNPITVDPTAHISIKSRPSKKKKSEIVIRSKRPNRFEESEAITKVFKNYNAFLEFQERYSRPIVEFDAAKVRI